MSKFLQLYLVYTYFIILTGEEKDSTKYSLSLKIGDVCIAISSQQSNIWNKVLFKTRYYAIDYFRKIHSNVITEA